MRSSSGDIPYNGMFTWDELLKKAEEVTNDELIERGEALAFDDAINIQYTQWYDRLSQRGRAHPPWRAQ